MSENADPPIRAGFRPDDPCRERIKAAIESVIDAVEDIFLGQLPSKALSYCAQEDVNAGLDALRERFSRALGTSPGAAVESPDPVCATHGPTCTHPYPAPAQPEGER